ncbi:MAG: CvpA family protein [Bordetella sp.]|nr:MAG: CvpA family protein [Bordetella sp.]
MTIFDIAIITILFLSFILGVVRGFIKEIFSLLSYSLAALGTFWYGTYISGFFEFYIENLSLRLIIAYLLTFISILVSISIIGMISGTLIRAIGLSTIDHGLGGVFGLIRGMLIIIALILLSEYTSFSEELWWKNAMFSNLATEITNQVKLMVPQSLKKLLL